MYGVKLSIKQSTKILYMMAFMTRKDIFQSIVGIILSFRTRMFWNRLLHIVVII